MRESREPIKIISDAKTPWVFIMGGMGAKPPKNLKKDLEDTESTIRILTQLRDHTREALDILQKKEEPKKKSKPEDKDEKSGLAQIAKITSLRNSIYEYDWQIMDVSWHLEKLKTDSIYGMLFPPTKMNLRVKLVNGTRTVDVDLRKSDVYDCITAASEKFYILEYINEIQASDIKPDRVVLTGYSRGASACLELSRALYLEFGGSIKIAIVVIDPVPGPGRHTKSKKVIPPNVDSLIVHYTNGEKNPIFLAQDMRNIFFNIHTTTVTTVVFPLKHQLMDVIIKNKHTYKDKVDLQQYKYEIVHECRKEISLITQKFWEALAGNKIEFLNKSLSDYSIRGRGIRKHGLFNLATHPLQNKNMIENIALREYHEKLLKNISPNYVYPVIHMNDIETRNVFVNDSVDRKEVLNFIYQNGKNLFKTPTYKFFSQENNSLQRINIQASHSGIRDLTLEETLKKYNLILDVAIKNCNKLRIYTDNISLHEIKMMQETLEKIKKLINLPENIVDHHEMRKHAVALKLIYLKIHDANNVNVNDGDELHAKNATLVPAKHF